MPDELNGAPDDDDDDDDDDGAKELAEMIRLSAADVDPGLTYMIFKQVEHGRRGPRYAHKFSTEPPETIAQLLDEIRERCGSGIYRIRIIRANGTYVKTSTVAVDADGPETLTLRAVPGGVPPPAPAATPFPQTSLDRALENFITVSARNQELIMAAIAGKSSTALEPVQLFKEFASILATTRSAVPEANGKAVIETVKEAITLAREFGPGESAGEKTGLWDVVRAVVENPGIIDTLKVLAENLRVGQGQLAGARPGAAPGQLPAPAVPPPGAPPIPQPAPNADAPAGDPQQLFDTILSQTIPGLAAKAAANASPSLYAEVVLDSLPPDLSRAMCHQPDILERLIERFPIVAENKAWWDRLLAEMRLQLAEEEGGESSANGAATDSAARLHP